jgi:hypothetical protein
MPTEEQKARLSQARGHEAANMPHEEAKKFIADSAKIDTDWKGSVADTADEARRQEMDSNIRSMKRGGTVRKTGLHRLHKGERVLTRKQNRKKGSKRR